MADQTSFLVIGLGTFGRQAAVALAEGGATVIAIDSEQDRVDRIAHQVAQAVRADGTDEEALAALGAFDVDVAIVSVGDYFDITVLVTHMLARRRVPQVMVQVNSQREASAIRAVGATSVCFPERDTAERIAHDFLDPHHLDKITIGRDAGIIEVPLPTSFVGRTLSELDLRRRHGVNVVAVKTFAKAEGSADHLSVTPDPNLPLAADQALLVLGHTAHLARFREAVRDGK